MMTSVLIGKSLRTLSSQDIHRPSGSGVTLLLLLLHHHHHHRSLSRNHHHHHHQVRARNHHLRHLQNHRRRLIVPLTRLRPQVRLLRARLARRLQQPLRRHPFPESKATFRVSSRLLLGWVIWSSSAAAPLLKLNIYFLNSFPLSWDSIFWSHLFSSRVRDCTEFLSSFFIIVVWHCCIPHCNCHISNRNYFYTFEKHKKVAQDRRRKSALEVVTHHRHTC
jgi:hypothetical protein